MVDHGLTTDDDVSYFVSRKQKEKVLNIRRKMRGLHLLIRRARTSLAFFPKTLCRSSLATSCLSSELRLICWLISHNSAALKLEDLWTTFFMSLIGERPFAYAAGEFYQNGDLETTTPIKSQRSGKEKMEMLPRACSAYLPGYSSRTTLRGTLCQRRPARASEQTRVSEGV
jgi:hypothetical protein